MSEKYIYSIVLLRYCIFNWEQSSIKYKIWSILLIYKVANRLDTTDSSMFLNSMFKLIPESKLLPVLDKLLYIC